jgi:hypothetical protein
MLSCSVVSSGTQPEVKSYKNRENCIFDLPAGKTGHFKQIPGVLPQTAEAEIKPVEPDQGNACAGKVSASASPFLFL